MAIINPVSIGADHSEPTSGDYLVRFIDFDGTILKEQWVNAGQAATAPTLPTHQYLTFDEWNNDFANIQHDLDVGATYYTTDGKTYLFMRFTNTTGLQPAIYLNKATTGLMTINWGDGSFTTTSASGNVVITKTDAYAAIGDYIITIECAGNYSFYTYIFNNNAAYNSSLLDCYLGKNVTSIGGAYAFQNCLSLTSIVIPDGVTSIGAYAFYYCYSLTSIVIPDGVASIGTNAFHQCFSLTSIVIPDGVASIGENAFRNCFSLTSIVIPYGVASIGTYAFSGNYSILKYVVLSTTPPSLASIDAFNLINRACKIYVPDASVSAYQAATNWVTYASYIYPISELPEYAGTIFWQTNGADPIKEWRGTPGTLAPLPIEPTKAGFTFAGWYKDEALTTAWDQNTDVCPATNITLYAKWI